MWEYIVVAICFGALIIVKFYLFKVSYDKKMKYYSDPDEMAVEFNSNMEKQNTEEQIRQTINNIHLLAKRNFTLIQEQFNSNMTDEAQTIISDKLRNTCIIIALIKYRNKNKQQVIKDKFKIIGQTLYQDFTILTKLIEWCNANESEYKNVKKSSRKMKEIDINLVDTIKTYCEYINNELSDYFKSK